MSGDTSFDFFAELTDEGADQLADYIVEREVAAVRRALKELREELDTYNDSVFRLGIHVAVSRIDLRLAALADREAQR